MIRGLENKCFVAGEKKAYQIRFTEEITALIEHVLITSTKFNICEKMEKTEDNLFVYRFSEDIQAGIGSFDIEIVFIDKTNDITTGLLLEVKERKNKPTCEV